MEEDYYLSSVPVTGESIVAFYQGQHAGDDVVVVLYGWKPPVASESQTADGVQYAFNLHNLLYRSGENYLDVYVDSMQKTLGVDYALSTDPDTYETVVTFTQLLTAGTQVEFKLYKLVEGMRRVDRTTVLELGQITSHYSTIQAEVDKANLGLNPLGLAKDSLPFDIDPAGVANGQTHFEQIYDRAETAMNNAIAVFNHAGGTLRLSLCR